MAPSRDDNDPHHPGPEDFLPPNAPEQGDLERVEDEASGMSFLDHLEELRWTLLKCLGAFLAACVLIGLFLAKFASLLRWPFDFATRGRPEMAFGDLINTEMLGAFSVMFQLFFVGGFIFSLPAMLFFIGQFIFPGLNTHERKILLPAALGAFGLFVTGATFCFFVLLPAGLRASFFMNDLLGFELILRASSYYGLLLWATMGVGAAFEFPLLLLVLIHLGVLTVDQLRHYRRHAIVGFLVLSAVVTPTPDPITFLFLAVPLYLLYEFSILVG
ncbi:MAG: twin-arginine translocase subunit TatC, partial [Opitutales bacterium]